MRMSITFIDMSWKYVVKNEGLIRCKEGTRGDEVAAAIRQALEKHNFVHKVYSSVKDLGGVIGVP